MEDSSCDFAFGSYRLSLRERLLFGPDGHVALGSRAFDTLAVLINGKGNIVSKDLLMSSVWPGVFVDENNLQVQISTLRRVLVGDAGQQFIQTVPGRGYRFTAKIVDVPGPGTSDLSAATMPQSQLNKDIKQPDEPAHNLPVQLTPMIGRIRELEAALVQLEQARLVSLIGPGGIGKTKLALNTARAAMPHFPQGCWWIELGTVSDPALLPDALSAALKIPELPGRALGEGITVWLRSRKLLLIFDNCEHLIGSVAEVAEGVLQACPDVRILVTSQEPLGIEGERICRIAPFEVPEPSETVDAETALLQDAVRLFVERAGAGDQRFELTDMMVPAVLEICRHLDGIPLALELAAARLPLLGLEPLRKRIASGFALRDDGHRRGLVRHRTLRAAIEWSYGLCSPRDCQILRRLSVFVGGFTLDAAQAVAHDEGSAGDEIVLDVSNLARRSLLAVGANLLHPRYRMLQPMQSFASEKLNEAGERESVSQRHADYMLARFQQADEVWEETPSRLWMPPLMAEMENLRAALNWCLIAHNNIELGVRLAAATTRFWFESFKFAEGKRWLEHALDASPPDWDDAVRLRLLRGISLLAQDTQLAVTSASQAVELARLGKDPGQLGVCLRTYAAALYRQESYADAEIAALEALDLLTDGKRPKTQAQCISDLCILRWVARDLPAARRLNADAQALLKEVGDDRGAAICLQYSAEFEFAAGNAASAAVFAEEAVTLFRSLNAKFLLGISLGNIAAYALALDDVPRARAAARETLALAREIEDLTGILVAIEHLALAAALTDDIEIASRLYGYSDHVYTSQGIERQATERLGHDRLTALFAEKLSAGDHQILKAEGAQFTQSIAMIRALNA